MNQKGGSRESHYNLLFSLKEGKGGGQAALIGMTITRNVSF